MWASIECCETVTRRYRATVLTASGVGCALRKSVRDGYPTLPRYGTDCIHSSVNSCQRLLQGESFFIKCFADDYAVDAAVAYGL